MDLEGRSLSLSSLLRRVRARNASGHLKARGLLPIALLLRTYTKRHCSKRGNPLSHYTIAKIRGGKREGWEERGERMHKQAGHWRRLTKKGVTRRDGEGRQKKRGRGETLSLTKKARTNDEALYNAGGGTTLSRREREEKRRGGKGGRGGSGDENAREECNTPPARRARLLRSRVHGQSSLHLANRTPARKPHLLKNQRPLQPPLFLRSRCRP